MASFKITGKTKAAEEAIKDYGSKRFSWKERLMMRSSGVKWDKELVAEPLTLRLSNNLIPQILPKELAEEYRQAVYENLLLKYKVPIEDFKIEVFRK